jgi:hypothetical protein
MKTSIILRTMLLASMFTGNSAQAADPQPAPATPDIAKLMAMLNQLAADAGEANVADDAAPVPVAKRNPAPPFIPATAAVPRPSASSLRMAVLEVSAPLGGRGSTAIATATESIWRALFPQK